MAGARTRDVHWALWHRMRRRWNSLLKMLWQERKRDGEPSLSSADITIHTVDGFQGQERDGMLVSHDAKQRRGEVGFLSEAVGFTWPKRGPKWRACSSVTAPPSVHRPVLGLACSSLLRTTTRTTARGVLVGPELNGAQGVRRGRPRRELLPVPRRGQAGLRPPSRGCSCPSTTCHSSCGKTSAIFWNAIEGITYPTPSSIHVFRHLVVGVSHVGRAEQQVLAAFFFSCLCPHRTCSWPLSRETTCRISG